MSDSVKLARSAGFQRALPLRQILVTTSSNVKLLVTILLLALALPRDSNRLRAEDYKSVLALGDARYQQLDEAGALAQYERARQLAPDNFDVLQKLTGACLDVANELAAKKSKDAESYYYKAVHNAELMLQKFPNKAESYFYVAATYGSLSLSKRGREKVKLGKDVETYAKKALELNPNFAPPYAVLGVFYREVANLNWVEKAIANNFFGGVPNVTYEDSARMLLKGLQLDPTSLYANYQLAITYEMAGKRSEEVRVLKQIAALAPKNGQEVAFKADAQRRLEKLQG